MKNVWTLSVLALALMTLAGGLGCSSEHENSTIFAPAMDEPAMATATLDGEGCVTLLAGQTIDAGTVCVEVVDEDLMVTYTTHDGWELTEAHLWIGEDLAGMPQTRNGNPKVGNFPYHSGDISGATSYSFTIPLSDLGEDICGREVYVAAHAALQKDDGEGGYLTETGWGDGVRFVERGNWATYFTVLVDCSEPPPPEGTCETAFAWGGDMCVCFIDLPYIDTERWGWTIGPLGTGSYTFDLYAGAGQCDLTNGTVVGFVTVEYDEVTGVAVVNYYMNSGFTMSETHLYVGTPPLPVSSNNRDTVAPGQYPFQHELDGASEDTYVVTGLAGEIHVIAHAVVCGDYPG